MGPKKGDKKDKDCRVIVPDEENFKYQLEEGSSEVTSNDQKFEMNFDFREFARTDIKITIYKTVFKMVAYNETEEEINEFDEEIEIPKRVLSETLTCKMNKNGVLRISAPLQPDDKQAITKITKESQMTIKRTVESESKSSSMKATMSAAEVDEETQPGDIVLTPKIANFEFDEREVSKPIQFRKNFSVDRYIQAYLKVDQYKANELKVRVRPKKNVVEIVGKSPTASFKKEIPIPEGVKPENIECVMNSQGVMRIQATEPQAEIEPGDIILTPKIANFEFDEREVSKPTQFRKNFSVDRYIQAYLKVDQYKANELKVRVRPKKNIVEIEGKSPTASFKKEIPIPEGVKPENIECVMNSQGVMRIQATETAEPPAQNEPGDIILTPKIAKFECDDREVSKPTKFRKNFSVDRYIQAYLKVDQYKANELMVRVRPKRNVVEIEGKSKTASFKKEMPIPEGVKPENIECVINSQGVMRIQATETAETHEELKDAQVVTVKKETFECPPQAKVVTDAKKEEMTLNHAEDNSVQAFANLSQFKFEQISVKKTSTVIRIHAHAKQERREFFKEVTISEDIDSSTIDCAVNPSGILRVRAERRSSVTSTTSSTSSRTTTKHTVQKIDTGSGNFGAQLTVPGYLQEEIKTSIENGWITITGTQEKKAENAFRGRSFTKKIRLPQLIKPESIVFNYNAATGVLDISSN